MTEAHVEEALAIHTGLLSTSRARILAILARSPLKTRQTGASFVQTNTVKVAEVETFTGLLFKFHCGDEIGFKRFHGISSVCKLVAVLTGPTSSAHAFASNTNTIIKTTPGALTFELTSLASVGTITEANSSTTNSSAGAIVGTDREILASTVVSRSPRFTEAFT